MNLAIFGASGALGGECLAQCLEAGHQVTVLARSPSRLPKSLIEDITVVEGDALTASDVDRALLSGCEAVLFAIGVDNRSPEDLCTIATQHIFAAMRKHEIERFVWCGGGSTLVEQDAKTLGARFVELFAATFMGLRHRDKANQLAFLRNNQDIGWIGIRPLQMNAGPRRGEYRVGYDRFSGLSKISFADCATAMIQMLSDDRWLHETPIVQY